MFILWLVVAFLFGVWLDMFFKNRRIDALERLVLSLEAVIKADSELIRSFEKENK